MENISQEFGISWPLLVVQLVNLAVVVGLFIWAARWILREGRGWEVPVWLVLAFFIPVVFPIISIIYFRRRHGSSVTAQTLSSEPIQEGEQVTGGNGGQRL